MISINYDKMALLLGVSTKSIQRWVKDDGLSYTKKGDKVFFELDDIKKNIELHGKRSTKVLSIANRKGGVGKTTIAINIVTILHELGFKVLVIDVDEQGDCTEFYLGEIEETQPTVYNIFAQRIVSGVISKTKYRNIDIVPANLSLGQIRDTSEMSIYRRLQDFLDSVGAQYDFVIIDCPPQISIPMQAAFVASDAVLAVVVPGNWAMDGLNRLQQIIVDTNSSFNSRLKIIGGVPNKINTRRVLDKELLEEEHLAGVKMLKNYIPEREAYKQAINVDMSIFEANIDVELIAPFVNLTLEALNELDR